MSCLSNPHPMPLPPYPHAGMTLIGAWENLVLVVVFVLESKGLYFTVNYRIIADLSRKAHPSFSCPILRENWMHGMHDIQLTWNGECLAKVCLRHFRYFHFLSAPAPHRNFILIVLSSVYVFLFLRLQEYLVFCKYWWVNFCFTIHIFILLLFCVNLWRYSKH